VPEEQTPISSKAADEVELISKLDGPISDLDQLQRSLLFAEISMISYLPESQATAVAPRLRFTNTTYIERDGAQAYIFTNDDDLVIACRGTEPNEWNDIKADANAFTDLAETVGRVHRGFKREVDDLWPKLEEVLQDDSRTTWFTGHSLGGAMATICAGRCYLSHIPAMPKELHTFGSPRVGTKRYVHNTDIVHYRWVNNNDVVTRVPPAWLRYRHTGQQMYLNTYGKLRLLTPQQRAKDRWRGFRLGLKQGKMDPFSDHAIVRYVEYVNNAVAEQATIPERGRFGRRKPQ
jgi:triacylglycerol lipase